jgi:hypothetical protein
MHGTGTFVVLLVTLVAVLVVALVRELAVAPLVVVWILVVTLETRVVMMKAWWL